MGLVYLPIHLPYKSTIHVGKIHHSHGSYGFVPPPLTFWNQKSAIICGRLSETDPPLAPLKVTNRKTARSIERSRPGPEGRKKKNKTKRNPKNQRLVSWGGWPSCDFWEVFGIEKVQKDLKISDWTLQFGRGVWMCFFVGVFLDLQSPPVTWDTMSP